MTFSCSKKNIYIVKWNNLVFLNFPYYFRTKNNLKYHEKVCKNKVFVEIVLPSQKYNLSGLSQYMKSNRTPYIICAKIES